MRRWLVLVVLVLVMGAVLGRVLWKSWRGREVSLATIGSGRVVTAVYATGRVDSDQRATLRARVAGPLAAVRVGAGQPVKEGEEVARQDDAALRLATERAVGELEAARASFAQAQDEATRSEKLVRDGLLAEDAWVRARERARELAAQTAAMESAVRITREQQSWTELRSPLSGVVTALLHRAGDPLREGTRSSPSWTSPAPTSGWPWTSVTWERSGSDRGCGWSSMPTPASCCAAKCGASFPRWTG